MEDLGGGLWGGVIAPLGSAYVGFLVMLVVYARSERRDPRTGAPSARWPALLRRLAATAAGGFAVFMLIVVVFSFMFAEEEEAIGEALTGGGLLALLPGLAVLALLGWIESKVRRARRDQ